MKEKKTNKVKKNPTEEISKQAPELDIDDEDEEIEQAVDEILKDVKTPPSDKEVGYETGADAIKQMFDDYRSGDPRKKEIAFIQIKAQSEKLIAYIGNRHFPTFFRRYEEDMMQSGWVGFLTYIDRFDPDKGRISTYFYKRIVREMYIYVSKDVLKTPSHIAADQGRVKDAIDRLVKNGNQHPSLNDIAIETGMKATHVKKVVESLNRANYAEIDPDIMVSEDKYTDPVAMLLRKTDQELLYEAMDKMLSTAEREVLTRKCGIGREPQSEATIFAETGITKDRIPFLLRNAKNKIANYPRMQGYSFAVSRLENIRDTISFEPIPITNDSAWKGMQDAMEDALTDEDGIVSDDIDFD